MTATDLLKWTNTDPFVPFCIRLGDGRAFEVRRRQMVAVGKTHAYLCTYAADNPDLVDKTEIVGLSLIERIDPIQAMTGVL